VYGQPYLWSLVQQRHEEVLRHAQERHLAEQARAAVRGSRSGRGRVGLARRAGPSLLRSARLSE
jgi:hypothetical protein